MSVQSLFRVAIALLAAAGMASLAGCSSSPVQPEIAEPEIIRLKEVRAESAEGDYSTFVRGTPPLVTDRFILSSPEQRIVGAVQIIEARYEDTFVDIARTYNLGFDELVDANPGVDPWLPGEGTRVVLPTQFILPDAPQEGIVINLASKRLFWFVPPDEDGVRAVLTFPIGIGLEGSATPTGETTITQKARNPTWFVPANIRAEYAAEGNPLPAQVPPGPDNPLGKHALILGMPSYLLHGTNRPAGVGMRVSHGCVRLFPENIELLYEQVPVGEKVMIVDQPWLVAWHEGNLLLEVHQTLVDDVRDWPALLPRMLDEAMQEVAYSDGGGTDQSKINAAVSGRRGLPLPIQKGARSERKYIDDAMVVNNIVVLPPAIRDQVAQDLPLP